MIPSRTIFYIIFLIIGAGAYPISKLYLDNKYCQEDLKIYKEQEKQVKTIIHTNNTQINVIKKKLASNPNRAYREQLLAQIFTN